MSQSELWLMSLIKSVYSSFLLLTSQNDMDNRIKASTFLNMEPVHSHVTGVITSNIVQVHWLMDSV